jgi:hypothetical protein
VWQFGASSPQSNTLELYDAATSTTPVETEDPRCPSCGCLAITREEPESVRIRVLTVLSGVFDKFSDRYS